MDEPDWRPPSTHLQIWMSSTAVVMKWALWESNPQPAD